jgi:hypothetical protein
MKRTISAYRLTDSYHKAVIPTMVSSACALDRFPLSQHTVVFYILEQMLMKIARAPISPQHVEDPHNDTKHYILSISNGEWFSCM